MYSPWQDVGDAGQRIGESLNALAVNVARNRAMQGYRQQQLALQQQAMQMRGMEQQAQAERAMAGAGYDNARTSHQQSVDDAAQRYQQAVVARAYPSPMQNGPTIEDASQMALARELGLRALVRAYAGQVDNPPTAIIAPGQERINTLTGQPIGYLPPTPTFHSVPAGGTPYVLDQGQAMQAGPQTGFRPMMQQDRPIPVGLVDLLNNAYKYGDTNSIPQADIIRSNMLQHLAQPRAVNTAPNATPKRPTRAQASEYVQRLGSREAAMQQLQQDGYDISGYAD